MKCDSIQQVAVLGLGSMGHGIVQAFAMAGYAVNAYDEVPAARDSLHDRIRQSLESFAHAGLIDSNSIATTLSRIAVQPTEQAAVTDVQFVTEVVLEELGVKQALFKRLEEFVAPDTILASNSSTFPISQSGAELRHPERAIVTHYFNPAQIIPAVEVVPGPATSEETTTTTLELIRRIGKDAILIRKEVDGFLVNRIQMALAREVWDLLDNEVASAEDIDAAVRATMGLRLAAIGPLQVHDLGGLDVVSRVYRNLTPQLRSDGELPPTIQNMVQAGHYGIKSGQGFFAYPADTQAAQASERNGRLLEQLKLYQNSKTAS
jgi:3-hydroxybutyryl-CoA dehydrogenase